MQILRLLHKTFWTWFVFWWLSIAYRVPKKPKYSWTHVIRIFKGLVCSYYTSFRIIEVWPQMLLFEGNLDLGQLIWFGMIFSQNERWKGQDILQFFKSLVLHFQRHFIMFLLCWYYRDTVALWTKNSNASQISNV